MLDKSTVAAVARELGRCWDTVNIAVEATRELLLTPGSARLDGVRVIGVDEHKVRHEALVRREALGTEGGVSLEGLGSERPASRPWR